MLAIDAVATKAINLFTVFYLNEELLFLLLKGRISGWKSELLKQFCLANLIAPIQLNYGVSDLAVVKKSGKSQIFP